MFLTNKYTTWYYLIIAHAQQQPRQGYTENHHIIPKALGGLDDADNKVRLTAREHFVAHKLLVKMTVGKNRWRMSFAYNCFFIKNPKHYGRNMLWFSSREYQRRKTLAATATSDLHKGKTVSKETVEKILHTRRLNNKPYPDIARQVHSNNTKQRWINDYEKMAACHRTDAVREKISKANKGKNKHTDQGRKEISDRNKGNGNGRAKHIVITSPEGVIYHCHGNFQSFCNEHNLPFSTMCHILHKTREFKSGAAVGWNAEYLSGHSGI